MWVFRCIRTECPPYRGEAIHRAQKDSEDFASVEVRDLPELLQLKVLLCRMRCPEEVIAYSSGISISVAVLVELSADRITSPSDCVWLC